MKMGKKIGERWFWGFEKWKKITLLWGGSKI